jgi:hypothetical protein
MVRILGNHDDYNEDENVVDVVDDDDDDDDDDNHHVDDGDNNYIDNDDEVGLLLLIYNHLHRYRHRRPSPVLSIRASIQPSRGYE